MTVYALPPESFSPITFQEFKRRVGRIDTVRHAALVKRAYADADRCSEASISAAVQYVYREARVRQPASIEVTTVLDRADGDDALSG
jgi:6-phosphogluconolactonase (cycloisomerase 2 family)